IADDPTTLASYGACDESQNGNGTNGSVHRSGAPTGHHGGPLDGNGVGVASGAGEMAKSAAGGATALAAATATTRAEATTARFASEVESIAEQPDVAELVEAPIARHTPPPRRRVVRLVPRTITTALIALKRSVFRAGLTALGIIIGIWIVIAVVEIGQGSAKQMKESMASMGANLLQIMPGTASSGGVTFGGGSGLTLTPQDSDAISREVPALTAVAPIVRARCQIVYGNHNWVPMQMYGSTPEFLKVRDWENMDQGAMFTDRDVRNGAAVCVLGQTVVKNLFGDESPVGKDIRLQNVSFRVVGVLSRKGANTFGIDQDDFVLAPWTTVKARVSGSTLANTNQSSSSVQTPNSGSTTPTVNSLNQLYPTTTSTLYPQADPTSAADNPQPVRFTNVDQIMAQARSPEDVATAIEEITALLHERHHIRLGDPDDFQIRDMTEASNALFKMTTTMTIFLLVVATASLVVGGVGIMNI
ncbi:MAG TPA: ABC transporter permease, partial [Pirellulales bacterium]|nr:ABC transporter permease [Pirellulales bacterium]